MRTLWFIAAFAGLVGAGLVQAQEPTANGIEYPEGWQDWRVIATSHRTDNNTLRVILGNDAVDAARGGVTPPPVARRRHSRKGRLARGRQPTGLGSPSGPTSELLTAAGAI